MMFENWLRKEQIIVKKLFEKEYPKEAKMDAVEFVVEQARMCHTHNGEPCDDCELDRSEYCSRPCVDLISTSGAKEAVKIVEAWAKDHPRKTRQSDFLKQFPNADLDDDGYLSLSPCSINTELVNDGYCMRNCADCRKEYWLEVIE